MFADLVRGWKIMLHILFCYPVVYYTYKIHESAVSSIPSHRSLM